MNTIGLNLLIPDKQDPERDSVAKSFANLGGTAYRIGRFWDPPSFAPSTVRVYGSESFCLVLQQKLGLTLCSPSDELLLSVPPGFLKRKVNRQTLAGTASISFPSFVKPVMPKQFRGAVYSSFDELVAECRGLPEETAVFISEPVAFVAEARAFVLNGSVLDAAVYEGRGKAADAITFVTLLAHAISLPHAVVVDVGLIEDHGWVVIEFNAAWGSGLNGCDPDKVLPAILAASSIPCPSSFPSV